MLAILLLVSLPLQGVAAVAMPLCMAMDSASQAMVMAQDASHDTMGEACEHAQPAQKATHESGHQCDKCFVCYLAVTQAMTPFILDVASYGSDAMLPSVIDKIYQTVSLPPFHPPRPALA